VPRNPGAWVTLLCQPPLVCQFILALQIYEVLKYLQKITDKKVRALARLVHKYGSGAP
jgi:hypothetical protein